MRTIPAILIALYMVNYSSAQELIPMGEWRTHYNYQHTLLVEKVNSKAFASTPNSLLIHDEQGELSSFSSSDGLHDVNITSMNFDDSQQILALGYENGNIDVIEGSEVNNITSLLESTIIDGKQVDHISFYQNTINISTEFGIVVIDLDTEEVLESYRNLGVGGEKIAVRNSVFENDLMFLATPEGVLSGDRLSGGNLQDFNNWERFEGSPVFDSNIVAVAKYNDSIFAALASSLYYLSNEEWLSIPDFLITGESILKLKVSEYGLIILTDGQAYQLDSNGGVEIIPLDGSDEVIDIVEINQGEFWYAESSQGLSRLENNVTDRFVLEGPYSNIEKLRFINGQLIAFPKLDTDLSTTLSNGLGYSVFAGGVWTNIPSESLAGLDNFSDKLFLDDKSYSSSYGNGILESNNETIYNESNSTMEVHSQSTGNLLVSKMGQDRNGNLWVANPSEFPLHKLDGEGNWERFSFGFSSSEEPTSLEVNVFGEIWMTLGLSSGSGVLAFDPESSQTRYINTSNTSLPSNTINDLKFDHENEIWMATNAGVVYFPFTNGVIENSSIDVVKPIFEDGYLFRNKKVTNLEIDPGNRKWMGTDDGLWLFEDSGSELVHEFNKSNSALPSNNILDLAIDPNTGEVFVCTDLGIVSFRSDATSGTSTHQNVKIFPNPVRPDFNGLVGIDGLAHDAIVKITTVSGRLVREINAAGSGASWNLADYNGRRVNSGVYLVFSATSDGQDTFVGKIAVIN
ncbi:MAG: hypothetical protein JXR07_09265 [Reichenbachiella sp.]